MIDELMWKLIGRKECFNSRWFSISKNKALLPNGKTIEDYYVVENCDSVMILPIDAQENIIFKREFRLPVGRVLLELPAGGIESSDSSVLFAAKRELLEETGYTSGEWEYLGQTYDCPERCTAKLHLFVARNVVQTNLQHLDDFELIKPVKIPISKAIHMCIDGEICVNSCVHAIMRVGLFNST